MEKDKKSGQKGAILAMIGIFAAYALLRFPLFAFHGMKQIPLFYLIKGVTVIGVFGVIKGYRWTPLFTLAGYFFGFLTGYIFQRTELDPGGGSLNNLWQIWFVVMVGAILVGVLLDRKRMKAERETHA